MGEEPAAEGDAASQDPGRQVNLQRVGMAVDGGLFLQEQLWPLLPQELQPPAAAKATLRVIQRRAFRAVARGAGALLGLEGSLEEGVGAGGGASA